MPSYKVNLTLDQAGITRDASALLYREVVDVTRRVFNRANVLTPVDTTRLRAGNQMRTKRTSFGGEGEVFNHTAYSDAVHDGSRAHTIRPKPGMITVRPKNAKALRFMVGDRVVYARSVRMQKPLKFTVGGRTVYAQSVNMPARKGRPWIYRALKEVAAQRGYRITT